MLPRPSHPYSTRLLPPPPLPLEAHSRAKIIIYCLQRYSVILCLKLPFQEDIKGHPFFRNIDWQLLYDKKIEPPYNPNVVSWILKPLRLIIYIWQLGARFSYLDRYREV